jgi:hypothetical protein
MQSSTRFISAAPRSYLFTRSSQSTRTLSTTTRLAADKFSKSNANPFGGLGGMAPPRLPKEEQEIFESLQKQSTGAFSAPRKPPQINQSPDSSATDRAQAEGVVADRTAKLSSQDSSDLKEFKKVIEARGDGEELHPNVRRGAPPEFEGDVNPKTGEVGGPKNEPLRWGAAGEWAYNGRTTDF